jgi:protein involved in polysaccharide export with SLBB domain/beta-lactamase regulating signal transducer with metallopeptidase domain
MNTLNELLVHPVFQRLGWTLVHSVWQGAAIALLVAIALAMLGRRSSQARYLVSCGGLLLMFAALFVTFFVLPGPIVRHDVKMPTAVANSQTPTIQMFTAPANIATPAPQAQTLAQRLQLLLPLCAALWIIGIAIISIRHVGGWVRVQQLRQRATPLVGQPWDELMSRICAQLRVHRVVKIAESALVQVPSVVGYLKPIILMPACAMTGLSSQQLEGLIAHELAHVRRHDYLVNLVQIVIETLLFYHPAAWWLSKRIRQERENCCDDLAASVCGNRIAYVQALAAMEELRMVPGELVLGARGGNLLPRVRRLLGVQSPRQRSWSLTAAIVVVIVALVPLLVAQHKAKAEETKPATKSSNATTANVRAEDLVVSTEEYTIGVGDLVQVSIMDLTANGVETVKSERVSEKGEIPLPYLGRVKAAGLSASEFEKAVAKAYSDKHLIHNPQVSASVVEARGRAFSIIGNVARPGQYVITQNDFRLLDALSMAGGLTDSPESATVIRKDGDKDRPIVSPLKELTAGEMKYNIVIHPKDTILIGTPGKVPANPVAPADPLAAKPTPAISPEMKQLLDKKLPEVNFAAVPLSDAIDFIRDVTNANIVVAWNAIEGSGLGRNTPVTVRVHNVSVGKGLELVLDSASTTQIKLRYTVDENVIRIAPTPQEERASSNAAPARIEPVPAPKVDPKTKAMLERDLPEVNFDNVALSDVIDFLRDVTNANIFVNWNALAAAGIDRNSPVTLRLRNVAFGKVLDLLLASVSDGSSTLAYTVDQGVISISTAESKPTPDAAVLNVRNRINEIDLEIAKLQAQGVGPNHPGLLKLVDELAILEQRPVVSSDRKAAAPPGPATQPAKYRAVRIVVGPQKMTLDGKETTWEDAKKQLLSLPSRGECVLEVAVASDQMTLKQQQDAIGQARTLANELKFKYLSDVGIEPLGSKGGEAHRDATTQSSRWDHEPDQLIGVEYYVGGHVQRSGVYSFNGQPIRLRQALSAAGIEAGKWVVRIVARNADRTEQTLEVAIDTSELKTSDAKDPFVQPNDQIMVNPMNAAKPGEEVRPAPTTVRS